MEIFMKVILMQDVKAQGKKGDVVNVSDGYAKNFLFPKGLAREASNKNMTELKGQQNAAMYKHNVEEDKAKSTAAQMKTITVTVKAKAGENGKLFGSITSKDVAEELLKQTKIEIDKRKIDIGDGIKTLGEHTVKVNLFSSVLGEFVVKVVEE